MRLSKSFVLFLSFSFSGAALAQADTLCQGKFVETQLFSCQINKKTLSICKSNDLDKSKGYIQYRFGADFNKLDVEFPKDTQHPKDHFLVGTEDGNGTYGNLQWIRANRGDHSYVVYTDMINKGAEKSGVKVYKSNKLIADLKCNTPDDSLDIDSIKSSVPLDKINPDGVKVTSSTNSSSQKTVAAPVPAQVAQTPAITNSSVSNAAEKITGALGGFLGSVTKKVESTASVNQAQQQTTAAPAPAIKNDRSRMALAKKTNNACLPFHNSMFGKSGNDIKCAYECVSDNYEGFVRLALDAGDQSPKVVNLNDKSTIKSLETIYLMAHIGLKEEKSDSGVTCGNHLKEYVTYMLGETQVKKVVDNYDKEQAANKQKNDYAKSPAGQLESAYFAYAFVKSCHTARKGYALVYVNDVELNKANNAIKLREKQLLTQTPQLSAQKNALWEQNSIKAQKATQNLNAYNGNNLNNDMKFFCKSQMDELLSSVPTQAIKKDF